MGRLGRRKSAVSVEETHVANLFDYQMGSKPGLVRVLT